uniref:CBS domain-containing protein n=1 Tax=Solanum tuberosum TaxID=4113 RepID=M1AFS4_SOLTU
MMIFLVLLAFNRETGKTASRIPTSFRGIEESTGANTSSGTGNIISHSTHILHPYSRSSDSLHWGLTGERTVKRLRLSKGITVPDSTSIYDACRRMAGCRVDVLLLTDSNALLCGILMDKDITTRVIACEVNIQETPVSKDMTKHHVFVLSDTLVVEALQKMVLVVENGEVIALLDIAKCLYDAVAHLERASEKGKAIVAAVEGVEKNWGASVSGTLTQEKGKKQLMIANSDFMAKMEDHSYETYLSAVECLGVVGVEFPLFPCFVWCDCYPDLQVCIRVSLDISPAAPVLWPEVD